MGIRKAFLGSSIGLLLAMLPASAFALPPLFEVGGGYINGGRAIGSAKTQRHTGAGARGMHRAWKKRRASGRR